MRWSLRTRRSESESESDSTQAFGYVGSGRKVGELTDFNMQCGRKPKIGELTDFNMKCGRKPKGRSVPIGSGRLGGRDGFSGLAIASDHSESESNSG